MPKIIENIREKLLAEAKRQVTEQGYSVMTIRSVAKACGVGVGTVYNYFPSKDMLVASFMLEDWLKSLETIRNGCRNEANARDVLFCIYRELQEYGKKYAKLFEDAKAEDGYFASVSQRHPMLRGQLKECIMHLTCKQDRTDPDFLAEFIAESMLTWTMAGYEFEQIAGVVLQLL